MNNVRNMALKKTIYISAVFLIVLIIKVLLSGLNIQFHEVPQSLFLAKPGMESYHKAMLIIGVGLMFLMAILESVLGEYDKYRIWKPFIFIFVCFLIVGILSITHLLNFYLFWMVFYVVLAIGSGFELRKIILYFYQDKSIKNLVKIGKTQMYFVKNKVDEYCLSIAILAIMVFNVAIFVSAIVFGAQNYQNMAFEIHFHFEKAVQEPAPAPVEEVVIPKPVVYSYEAVKVIEIESSSFLSSKTGSAYPPDNMLDDDYETCWQDGVPGNGIGESIDLSFDSSLISTISIANGRQVTEEKYQQNCRLKEIEITFLENDKTVSSMRYSFDDANSSGDTDIELDDYVQCDKINIKVLDVYQGSKFDDLCVTEIKLVRAVGSN